MKRFFVKIITKIISINFLWKLIGPFASLSSLLLNKRRQIENRGVILNSSIKDCLDKLEVINGPFKGMKYPSLEAVGSSLYPKIIGSYEQELSAIFEKIKEKSYTNILDIGCAEGYYAVGLGRIFPDAKVYGFDINSHARKLCLAMAKLNSTDDRLVLKQKCNPVDLNKFKFNGKSLIISDCEGFEKHLFTPTNINNLINVDVLIEIHDFIDITISEYLEHLFEKTHHIHKVKSIDDLDKAKNYKFADTNNLSLDQKRILFAEGRPQIMEWFFCEPK